MVAAAILHPDVVQGGVLSYRDVYNDVRVVIPIATRRMVFDESGRAARVEADLHARLRNHWRRRRTIHEQKADGFFESRIVSYSDRNAVDHQRGIQVSQRVFDIECHIRVVDASHLDRRLGQRIGKRLVQPAIRKYQPARVDR